MKPLTKIYWLRFALGILTALLCIGYGFATGTIYTNLVSNRSVEAGTGTPQDWSTSADGTEWNTTYARTGSRSIGIIVNDASAFWNTSTIQVHSSVTYQVRGFFMGNVTAGQFFLTVRWFSDLDGVVPISENSVSIGVGSYPTWHLTAGEFNSPTDAKSCRIAFEAVNGTGDVYGDDFEVRQTESLAKLTTGVFLAIAMYIITYYIIKMKFVNQVEKPRKLVTTGIGIYFLVWFVSWILFYTLISVYL